mmetsp:Transcript_11401/g.21706  ORF Transcript_11401/g.21706 Transcript_11401/m.21706 type:complete len:262 (-) Transcript_11401:416-1201(-)
MLQHVLEIHSVLNFNVVHLCATNAVIEYILYLICVPYVCFVFLIASLTFQLHADSPECGFLLDQITVLDLRLANADRNGGNILVREKFPEDGCDAPTEKQYELIPIDHGYTLPHTLQDVSFEWEFWHQAEVPYSASTRAYIAKLDAENDLATLAAAGISLPAECARNLRVCTMLLKKGAEAGLSPAVIAGVMTRQLENKRSHLEKMTTLARNRAFGRGEKSLDKLEVWSDEEEVIYMKTFEKLLDEYLENIQEEHLLDGIS